ncbi:MAG: biopolymer transporter ExbD [Deltaproteobacteria bacterium]|nr:biopolymer transporter ExbD [Deltaproteobacteria bacterium]
MARKPSKRSNIENNDPKELNLVPYLDIVVNVIMFLIYTTTVIQMGVINVSAPKYGSGSAGSGSKQQEKPPLNLSVFITDKGFTIAATGGVLPGIGTGEEAKTKGPTIPKVNDPNKCSAMKRREEAPCYDYVGLIKKLAEIKKIFPDETKINISAEENIRYEVLVNVMDAARENPFERDENNNPMQMFYDVVFAAGL